MAAERRAEYYCPIFNGNNCYWQQADLHVGHLSDITKQLSNYKSHNLMPDNASTTGSKLDKNPTKTTTDVGSSGLDLMNMDTEDMLIKEIVCNIEEESPDSVGPDTVEPTKKLPDVSAIANILNQDLLTE